MAFFATTNGYVVDDSAFCVHSARSRARIDAFVVDAALRPRAVRVKDALRSAGAVRIANIIGRTDAIDGAVLFLALRVGAARIGIARPWWLNNVRLD